MNVLENWNIHHNRTQQATMSEERISADVEIQQIAESISGRALQVFPVSLRAIDGGDEYREPKKIEADTEVIAAVKVLQKLRRNNDMPIGTHAQLNLGLSGMCSFFLLQKLFHSKVIAMKISDDHGNIETADGIRIARLQYFLTEHRIKNTILNAFENVLFNSGIEIMYEKHAFLRLMISFHNKCFPRSHSDGATSKKPPKVNQFRLCWDLHPRGRIISFRSDEVGLFLENCGVHVCSKVMCGNLTYKEGRYETKAAARKRLDPHLEHQGWDCREEREEDCALVTIICDFIVTGVQGVNIHVESDVQKRLFEVTRSVDFQQHLETYLTEAVKQEMKILVGKRTKDQMWEEFERMNKYQYDKLFFGNTKYDYPEDAEECGGCGVDADTKQYADKLYDACAEEAARALNESMDNLSLKNVKNVKA